jgi:outer membrane protein assembly factor BamB
MRQVNYLYAVTPEGELKWRCKVGGEIKSSPAIGSDGTIYVGSLDSCVYAIRSDSKGLADSPWPKFQHDNQNTGRAGGGI